MGCFSAQSLGGGDVVATRASLGRLRALCAGTTPRALTLVVLAAGTSLGFNGFQCYSIVR
jgi:hypothetical protein